MVRLSRMRRQQTRFLEFVVDPASEQLWRGGDAIKLRPKTYAVLLELLANPGTMLSKDHLLAAVWRDTAVTDWVLSSCIKELRQALGDDPQRPRIIETVHRRGFRFIAPLADAGGAVIPQPTSALPGSFSTAPLVGRDDALDELRQWWREALAGRRQLGFLIGEPGIGKTTLLESFLQSVDPRGAADPRQPPVLIARGHCVDQHGEGEPYLPLLEAVGGLCRGPYSQSMIRLLRHHAPAWLVQLPGLFQPEEVDALERRIAGGNRERMLRDLASFVEALPLPLVLVVEDLHWSDAATLDVLRMMARRRDPARVLAIGTYRPVDATLRNQPLRDTYLDLRTRGECRDLWLQPLTVDAVTQYLEARLPGLDEVRDVATTLYRRTDGNPLFLVNVADSLLSDGIIARDGDTWRLRGSIDDIAVAVPAGLRQMIAAQVERLDPFDLSILEAASLVGRSFSAALVAATITADVVAVEESLDRLARLGQILGRDGESAWPDGTRAGAYRFSHALDQGVVAERLSPSHRRRLHGRIGERLDRGFGQRSDEIAAILAFHFESSEEPQRAVPFLLTAAELALRHGGGYEAIAFLRRALTLVDEVPASLEKANAIIELSLRLARALPTVHGFSHPDIETSYLRAIHLSEQCNNPITRFQGIGGLTAHLIARGQLMHATDNVAPLVAMMTEMPNPAFELAGNFLLGQLRCHTGPLAEARQHFERGLAAPEIPLATMSIDLRVASNAYLAITLVHLGLPEQGRARLAEAARRSEQGRPFERGTVAQAQCYVALLLRDIDLLESAGALASALGREHGLPVIQAIGSVAAGRLAVLKGEAARGIDSIRTGIAQYIESGNALTLPLLTGVLADALAVTGDLDAARVEIARGRQCSAASGDERLLAELQRLEGEVCERAAETSAAGGHYKRAIEIATKQGARLFELRARTSFAALASGAGTSAKHRHSARAQLATFLKTLEEGSDTTDYRQANELLRQFSE